MTEQAADDGFDSLLEYLQVTRGFEFGAYKRTTLQRRVQKRLQSAGLTRYADYVDFLEVHPDEFGILFNTILINVTDFFRDAPAWEVIRDTVIPRILAGKAADEPVRVWVAGCASGQEPYTIAILLAEAMGELDFRQRLKIYATDVDEEALNEARQAIYTDQKVQSVPKALREKYFEPAGQHYTFRKETRRAVIFGRHDLLVDAPISRVDLLMCRNTLMYFNAEAQARVLSRFDFALNSTGCLFLGKAEVLLTRSTAFTPLDLKHRIFVKINPVAAREHGGPALAVPDGRAPAMADGRLRELALEMDPVAQVVLDLDGNLVVVNAQARSLFNLDAVDLENRLMDMRLFRPMDLRFSIDQAVRQRRLVQLEEAEWPAGGERHYLDVSIYPLSDETGQLLGVKLLFTDVTRYRRLQAELQTSRQELETTNEELQSSNEELQTTNEELQSSNEELETTNEELQSTNEELETMNEELQSTNEELETANSELRQRGSELDRLNAFLESVMAGLRDGVVVLDSNLMVRAWNGASENLWGLRPEEVRGQHFLSLDIGLPLEQLRAVIRAGMDGEGDGRLVEVAATNRRGRAIRVQVNATRLLDASHTPQGVILVMQDMPPIEQDGHA